jgi:VCBS repeat-containing protein
MTLAGSGTRRMLALLVALLLAVGATAFIGAPKSEASYPGGNGWIAFQGEDFDIYVMPADGSAAPTNLTNSPTNAETDASFSPDGTKLAFSRDDAGSANVWVAAFDPTGPSLAASATWTQVTNGGADGEPTWSGDGSTIAFERAISFTVTGTATSDDGTGLVLTDTAATFLTDGVGTGRTVTNDTDGSSSTVASVDSETQLTLTAPLSGGTANTWTTGDAYTLDVKHLQVFKAPEDGTNMAGTLLSESGAEPAYDDRSPAWSPTAATIAFTTSRNGNSDVYTMADDGSAQTNLTPDTSFDNHATRPSWSPDGTMIALQSQRPNNTNSNIWTVNVSTLDSAPITGATSPGGDPTAGDNDVEPTWSPDGSLIAFRRSDTGGNKIYVVASDGTGAATRVGSASSPAVDYEPDWQPALIGVNDSYSVDEGGTLNLDAAAGVLANDHTLLGSVGTVTATLGTDAGHGTLTLNSNGSFTYVHDGSETTSDSFTYTPHQGAVTGSPATVTITINPVDDDPVATADGPYNVLQGDSLTVPAPGVLGNDTDPEGAALTAVLGTDVSHGTLTLNTNGSFTYENDGSSATTDSFTYRAKDPGGNLSAAATVSIAISDTLPPIAVTIAGTANAAPGIEASYTATVSGGTGAGYSYAWSATSGLAAVASGTTDAFTFTPTLGGKYTIELTVTDVSGSGSDTFELTVLSDISGSTFLNDIIWLADAGITKGCNPPANDMFCPTSNVTRGQMAAFLVRFLGLTDDGGGNTFVDDNGSIFEADIAKLAAAGITKGCNPPENDMFCPNDSVTRGQMAAFLHRADGILNP